MATKALGAITGLGFSTLSRKYIGTTRDLAIEAVNAAVMDSGLKLKDIDGLLMNRSPLAAYDDLPLTLQNDLGMLDLRLLSSVEGEGSSSIQMIQQAVMAIRHGMAKHVVCVMGDAPLKPGVTSGDAFDIVLPMSGIDGAWEALYGLFGAVGLYALGAQRYLADYGLSTECFGNYAISCRKWAELNPRAFIRKPLSMEEFLGTRWIVEPLRMLDCALPVNGAIAVVVSGAEAAADMPRPPVYIHGMGQGHGGHAGLNGFAREIRRGGEIAGEGAYAMAGVGPSDVSMGQFYDALTFVGLFTLEDYRLCARGEAAAFVATGATAPGGSLPVNTGGGHLSGFYIQGMTPISEAVIQSRGEGDARQVAKRDIILITGNGGRLGYHAALIVSPLRSLR